LSHFYDKFQILVPAAPVRCGDRQGFFHHAGEERHCFGGQDSFALIEGLKSQRLAVLAASELKEALTAGLSRRGISSRRRSTL